MNLRGSVTVAVAILIAACGGGGGETTAGIDGRGAPVRVGVVSTGTISGFGSIIVNGVRYDTSNATFDIDDQPGSESDLAVGQVVTIVGSTDENGQDAQADTVSFDDLVEGPVESVDAANSSFVVLGQTVRVNVDTVFDDDFSPSSLGGVAVGQVVEVSGFVDSTGGFLATYVELEDGMSDFEVTGVVANLDPGLMTFEINSLVVDYSNAMLEDFPNGGPENGQTVEAEGLLGSGGELVATRVEFEGDGELDADDGDDVEIEGLITRFASATDFDVNGIPVTTNSTTVFENGSANDLALDVVVEVEGEVDANGVVVADRIEFEQEGTLELRGLVEATTASSVTLLGIEATVTAKTDFDDQRDGGAFGLADIVVGDYIEVLGYDDNGNLTLTRLERDDDTGISEVIGPVSAVNEPDFTAVGVTIRTDAETEFEENETEIDAADFFASALGATVEVEGDYAGGVLTAESVEIDN